MIIKQKKRILFLCAVWMLIVAISLPASAFATTIYNQSGIGYSGTITANPLNGPIEMVGYDQWPTPDKKKQGFYMGSVNEGEFIWLIPNGDNPVVKMHKETGVMTSYSDWPSGFNLKPGKQNFSGGVFDGTYIWLIPHYADEVVRIHKDTGVMEKFNGWPSGFSLASIPPVGGDPMHARALPNFSGGVYDGKYVWLIPSSANKVIKIDKDGKMTINEWPTGYSPPSQGVNIPNGGFGFFTNFAGGVFDGQNIWLIPVGADRVFKIDKTSGEMTGYMGWPDGFSKVYDDTKQFMGGVFDGQYIWMIPNGASHYIKINKDSGVMTGYTNSPESQPAAFGGTFDGQNIWSYDNMGKQVIKFDTTTNKMASYKNFPTNFTPNGFDFNAGVFDGQNVWFVPIFADRVLKIQASSVVAVTGVTVNPSTLTIAPAPGGNLAPLTATVSPSKASNKSVTWTSSDPEVATVNANGVVKGLKAGTVTITVATVDGGYKATSTVTVDPAMIPVQSVILYPNMMILTAGGDNKRAEVTVAPENATNKGVTWTSSDPTVATVDSNGVVTPLKAGTTQVSVTTVDGGYLASSEVTVNPGVSVTGVTVTPNTLTLFAGDSSASLVASVTPNDATNKKVTWTSSNPAVATVDASGEVTPLKEGTTTITATTVDGNYEATNTVTVNPAPVVEVTGVTVNPETLTLTAGDKPAIITATVSPSNATNKDVTWTSSDSEVATVSPSGEVTPLKAGTTSIVVKTADGNKTKTIVVTVNAANVPVTGVEVSPTELTLTAGDKPAIITATVSPSNATNKDVTWTSSDPEVATVSPSGEITPLIAGTTTITVTTVNGKQTTIVITVKAAGIAAPTGLTATAGDRAVTLKWTSVQGSISYSVYQGTSAGSYGASPIASVSSASYTVTGLANGTTYYYIIKANNATGTSDSSNEASATPYGGSSDSGNSGPSTPSTSGGQGEKIEFRIIVNDKQYDEIATGNKTKQNGKDVLTATVETSKLKAQLAKEGNNPTVIIPLTSVTADKISAVLTGEAVKAMENKNAMLEVQTPNGNYKLPASEIAIDAISSQFGEQVKLENIVIQVDIEKSSSAKVELIYSTAKNGQFSVVIPPVDFTVTAKYNGKTVELDKFTTFVQREIPLPDGVDHNKITTGTVLLADGTVYHVPTYITVRGGKYYAVVSSLTNSTYSIVWHPKTFLDVEKHWSKNAVNDMASRMIVKGIDETHFKPNASITRAEFSAIIVRALGLPENGKTTEFKDVASGKWYVGSIAKAFEYGIIKGYEDGTFRPNQTITREEAMAMIARAMKWTALNTNLGEADIAAALNPFKDSTSVAKWAKPAVAATVKSGLVIGAGTELKPTSNITRAETAAIVQRLLINSKLIDAGNSK